MLQTGMMFSNTHSKVRFAKSGTITAPPAWCSSVKDKGCLYLLQAENSGLSCISLVHAETWAFVPCYHDGSSRADEEAEMTT